MYDSVLMNVAHTQAEPLNGDATRLYEALGVAKYVLLQLCLDAKYISLSILQVPHKRDKSVTKTETPEGVSTELTNTRAKNPAGVDLTNLQGFILAGVGFGNPRN